MTFVQWLLLVLVLSVAFSLVYQIVQMFRDAAALRKTTEHDCDEAVADEVVLWEEEVAEEKTISPHYHQEDEPFHE